MQARSRAPFPGDKSAEHSNKITSYSSDELLPHVLVNYIFYHGRFASAAVEAGEDGGRVKVYER